MAFSDTFTDTGGTNLESHTPSGGTAWTLQSGGTAGSIRISSGGTGINCATAGSYYTCADQGSADQYILGDHAASLSYGINLCARFTDTSNWIGWRNQGTGAAGSALVKKVAGVTTNLVTFQPLASDETKVVGNGSTIQIFQNGTQKGTDQTVTNFTTVTTQAIYGESPHTAGTQILTYFEAGALGGGGTTGTSATTNANDTASASGTTTVVGTAAASNAADTSSATGTTTVVGSSTAANAADSSAASGTTTILGTAATTNANDTASASGTAGAITGTVDYTNLNDTLAASGWAGTVSGTVAYTNHNDTLAASGHAGSVQWGATGGLPAKKKKKEWRDRDRESRRNAILAQLTPAEPLPPAPIIAKPAIDNQALRDLLKRVKRADIMPAYIEKPVQKVAVIEDDEEEELLLLL